MLPKSSPKARAELVLMEPGAAANLARPLRPGNEQRYVMLRGADEPLPTFQQRVLRRMDAMHRASQELCHLTYVAGRLERGDWTARSGLLSQLCGAIARRGRFVVHAFGSVSTDVLGVIGDLPLSAARELDVRAVFGKAASA